MITDKSIVEELLLQKFRFVEEKIREVINEEFGILIYSKYELYEFMKTHDLKITSRCIYEELGKSQKEVTQVIVDNIYLAEITVVLT